MKFRKINIYLAGLAGIAAILVLPVLASAEDITVSKMQGTCNETKDSIRNYLGDLAASSDKYKNLATTTIINGVTVAAQKESIRTAASSSLDAINGYCPTPTVTTTYAAMVNKRDATLAVLRKLSVLDGYYAKFRELAANYDSIHLLTTDSDFSNILINNNAFNGEENIITRAIAATEQNIALLNNPLNANALFAHAAMNDLNPYLNDYNIKLSRNIDLVGGASRLYSQALKARKNVITRAAQEGIVKTAPDDYRKLLEYYGSKATSTVINLQKDIANKIATLSGYAAKIKKASHLQPNTTSTLISSYIIPASTSLALIKTTTTVGLSYFEAAGNLQLVSNLKINEILIPVLNLALTLNDSLRIKNELATIRSLAIDTAAALRLGLDQAGQSDLDLLISKFQSVDLTVLGDASAIESSLSAVISSKQASDLAALKNNLNAYNKNLAEASRKIYEYRRQWWKLIDSAAARGDIDLPAGLAAEKKASKAFADFEKRREAYYSQARRIIDSRKNTIEDNQLAIDMLLNIPAEIKNQISIAGTSTRVVNALDSYYEDKVSSTSNYGDLKKVVDGIKNFKINEVYIPLQKIYYRGDSYYKKYDLLHSIMNDASFGLTAQIAAISTPTPEITELSDTIASMLPAVKSDLDGLMTDTANGVKGALANYSDANLLADNIYVTAITVTSAEIKSLLDRESYIKKSLDKIISKVRDLNAAIKRAK